MSDFTVQDVRDFFTGEFEEGLFEDGYDEFLFNAKRTPSQEFMITLNGKNYAAQVVEEYDDGREWERNMHYVFKVDGRTFKFPGKFISHHGSEWHPENIVEGKTVVKEVTVYE